MSGASVLAVGRAVVLIGALLELRHLIAAVLKHFAGCDDFGSAVTRLGQLDDATIVGTLVCAILAMAIVVTVFGEFGHAFARWTSRERVS